MLQNKRKGKKLKKTIIKDPRLTWGKPESEKVKSKIFERFIWASGNISINNRALDNI